LYVTNLLSDSVSAVELSTGSAKTIPVGDGPESCALSPDGAWLYVTNQKSDSITIVNARANTVAATVPAPVSEPRGIAIAGDAQGGFLIVGVGASSKAFTALGRP
jgi:YVTN family beta-propeller protein